MNKLVIDDPDPEPVRRIEDLALHSHVPVSVRTEHLLQASVSRRSSSDRSSRLTLANSIAAMTPPGPQTPAEVLLRGDRDR